MHTPITKCRICGSTQLKSLLSLGDMAYTGHFPLLSYQETNLRGPLELVRCMGECGLVQLGHNFPLNEMYGEGYGYRSGLNKGMVNHLFDIHQKILNRTSLECTDVVLDIGSNDGTLLNMYSSDNATLIGFDPSSKQFAKHYRRDIYRIDSFFSAAALKELFGDRKAKIVTSIAMFYDLPDPLAFMRDIASILADDGIWYTEQSYLPSMLKNNSYDTICHEHLEYYCLSQIQWMCEHSGLKIIDVSFNDINGGSFGVTMAKKESRFEGIPTWCFPEWGQSFNKFSYSVHTHNFRLSETLRDIKRRNKLVLGYGASTKGNVILQYCGITPELLPCIADVNEDKWGHYTPGTNIPIVSEAKAKELKPDYFLVLPWHFRDNIIKRESEWIARGGKLIFPLPEIEIYPK